MIFDISKLSGFGLLVASKEDYLILITMRDSSPRLIFQMIHLLYSTTLFSLLLVNKVLIYA